MEKVSDKDIGDVIKFARLQHSNLENLFVELGLKANEIEKAKKNADSSDIKLQAASVLRSWRRSRGNSATRRTVITALKECRCNEAEKILQEKWKMTTGTTGNSSPQDYLIELGNKSNVGNIQF